jgi:hypothetical protein
MAVVGGAIACIILLFGIVLDFGGGRAEEPALPDEPDAGVVARPSVAGQPSALRRRSRPVPKFEVVAPKAPPPVAAAPVPTETQEQRELTERASKDDFIYREAGSQTIYVVKNGTRWPVRNAEELQALGLDPNSVQEVPPNSLRFLRSQPPDRTFWRERDRPEVFYYENGQKRWITDEAFRRMGADYKEIKVLPSGGLQDHTHGAPILR